MGRDLYAYRAGMAGQPVTSGLSADCDAAAGKLTGGFFAPKQHHNLKYGGKFMEFFNSAVDTLQTIVVGLGGALCVWGGINLLEGYGQDNPASNAHVR